MNKGGEFRDPGRGAKNFVTGFNGVVGSKVAVDCSTEFVKLDVTLDDYWQDALRGKETVIHCAGLASSRGVTFETVREVNVVGAKRVARFAREAGVKRFLFLSSVKVLGEFTKGGEPFRDDGPLMPSSVYAESKAEAEVALMAMHEPGQFEVVIIRPSVVVAPNAKGAVGQMARLARKGLPFPVVAGGNRRDFVSLDNLVEAIFVALNHPDTGGKAFSITDGATVSTGELFEAMAEAYCRRAVLVAIPRGVSKKVASLFGKEELWERVFGNLEVDGGLFRKTTGWNPGVSTLEYVEKAFGPDKTPRMEYL